MSDDWRFDDPKDGIYICWTDAPPQAFKVQAVRRKDGEWLTSWPVVAYQGYPSEPKINQTKEG